MKTEPNHFIGMMKRFPLSDQLVWRWVNLLVTVVANQPHSTQNEPSRVACCLRSDDD